MGILDSILKLNIDEMKTKRDFEGLFKSLGDKRNAYIRRDAAKALGDMGDAMAMERLISALKDPSRDVRDAVAEAIGKMGGDPRAVETVAGNLKSGKTIEREEAVVALGKIKHKSGVEHLLPALKDQDCFVRQSAAAALGEIGDPGAIEPLTQVLKDEDRDVRRAAVASLGEIGTAAAVVALIAALKDGSVMVQCQAVESLGEIGGSSAVDPLIGILKDGGWIGVPAGKGKGPDRKVWVRQKAIEALAKIGDTRAIAPVTEVLNDKQGPVRLAAQEALQKLGAIKPDN